MHCLFLFQKFGLQKKFSSGKLKSSTSDIPKPPEKINWVLADPRGNTWNPFIGESMIPEPIKQRWANRFAVSIDDTNSAAHLLKDKGTYAWFTQNTKVMLNVLTISGTLCSIWFVDLFILYLLFWVQLESEYTSNMIHSILKGFYIGEIDSFIPNGFRIVSLECIYLALHNFWTRIIQ